MINDDILIKLYRNIPQFNTIIWPIFVRGFKKQLNEVKLGFPGIGDNHMTITSFGKIQEGEIFILDLNLLKLVDDAYNTYNPLNLSENFLDTAPRMLKKVGKFKYEIVGIGRGFDTIDPKRNKHRWKDIIEFGTNDIFLDAYNIKNDSLVLKVDVRPTEGGGPGYYYFFKSYRDQRL